jgi:hypothetical protein
MKYCEDDIEYNPVFTHENLIMQAMFFKGNRKSLKFISMAFGEFESFPGRRLEDEKLRR